MRNYLQTKRKLTEKLIGMTEGIGSANKADTATTCRTITMNRHCGRHNCGNYNQNQGREVTSRRVEDIKEEVSVMAVAVVKASEVMVSLADVALSTTVHKVVEEFLAVVASCNYNNFGRGRMMHNNNFGGRAPAQQQQPQFSFCTYSGSHIHHEDGGSDDGGDDTTIDTCVR
jgi:hypothetical protein